MYYYLTPDKVTAIDWLLERSSVKGKDAKKVKDFIDAINVVDAAPYFLIDEKNVKFVAGIMNETVIPAKTSAVYLEVIMALSKPVKELPPDHKARMAAKAAKQTLPAAPRPQSPVESRQEAAATK